MKYSEYLELVKAQIPSEKFICYAVAAVYNSRRDIDNLQGLGKKLCNYIKHLLEKEDAMRFAAAARPRLPATTLYYVLGRPVGRSEKISARVSLLNEYIAYHKARGN